MGDNREGDCAAKHASFTSEERGLISERLSAHLEVNGSQGRLSSGRLRHGAELDKPYRACTWKFPACPWADGVGRAPEGAWLPLEQQWG